MLATARATATDDAGVDSRWWYWIVVTPLYGGTVFLFGAGLATAVLLGESTDVGVFLPAFLALAVPGAVFVVGFPLALYRDAAAVAAGPQAWEPDRVRWAAFGVIAVVTACVGTVPLSAYYLYERHVHVGAP